MNHIHCEYHKICMFTTLSYFGHTGTSNFDPIRRLLDAHPTPPTVLLTNVHYGDDGDYEMQAIIDAKMAQYPSATIFVEAMHELVVPTGEADSSTVVIDNLNLYISNLLLLANSQPDSYAMLEAMIVRELSALVHLAIALPTLTNLVLIGADTDFDLENRSPVGLLYNRLHHKANSILYPIVDELALLTNGVTWTLRSRTTHSPL